MQRSGVTRISENRGFPFVECVLQRLSQIIYYLAPLQEALLSTNVDAHCQTPSGTLLFCACQGANEGQSILATTHEKRSNLKQSGQPIMTEAAYSCRPATRKSGPTNPAQPCGRFVILVLSHVDEKIDGMLVRNLFRRVVMLQ